ncbi:hypothetical protein [Polaromonas sp.]|uniref:hypothetical protein n=1 Tax=Polaromonas sp. TaxID=1869339 RepID=UPI0032650A0B
MKERQWLAVAVGALGVYLLVHALMAAYALYFATEALRPPVPIDLPYLPELRENYPTLVVLCVVVGALSMLSLAASVAFYRNSRWAVHLWGAASLGLLVGVVLAVASKGVVWTHYLFEVAAVSASWWYFLRLRQVGDEG